MNMKVIIDVWSHGCVFAELLLTTPIFPGSSGVDQLVEIIKVLGNVYFHFANLHHHHHHHQHSHHHHIVITIISCVNRFYFLNSNLNSPGTPTKDELKFMNPNYVEFKFPQIRAHPLSSVFKPATSPMAVDLLEKMLRYVPERRLKAIEVLVFFIKNMYIFLTLL